MRPFTPEQEDRLREIVREELRAVAEESAKAVADHFRSDRIMRRLTRQPSQQRSA